ncbi:AzlC family ABC transporter permease [Acuticoccus sp.]|uniref:AzlC family ABC transporter permease n=1 Tax=Acuticoccus sp. TaxID=1904378 RepID=UPI003B522CDB
MSAAEGAASPRLTGRGMRRGARRLAPVSLFVLPFGLAYGAAAVERGLSAAEAIVLSATVFAGAAQFAALDLWTTPLPYLSLAAVVFAVNARHIILGAALSPWFNALPVRQRMLALLLLSDANFADARAAHRDGETDAGVLLGGGLVLWLAWVVGTALGASFGAVMGDLARFGVDVVMAAFFAAVVTLSVGTRRAAEPVVVACVVAVATMEVLPLGWNLIAAALAGGVVGALRHDGRTGNGRRHGG